MMVLIENKIKKKKKKIVEKMARMRHITQHSLSMSDIKMKSKPIRADSTHVTNKRKVKLPALSLQSDHNA